jgi:hypothetical protein
MRKESSLRVPGFDGAVPGTLRTRNGVDLVMPGWRLLVSTVHNLVGKKTHKVSLRYNAERCSWSRQARGRDFLTLAWCFLA